MRVRSIFAGVAAVAALAFAGQAAAANVTVWAGPGFLKAAPAGAPKSADANLFFPQRVVVHVGDTVTFKSQEFHTATYLGSHKASEFQIFMPATDKSTYTGINDAAGSPFYFNGQPKFAYNVPQVLAPQGGPVVVGGSAVQSSGVLDAKKGYSFKFTKPGTYTFRCLIHPMMTAHVVVKPASAAVTSPSQVLKANAAELASAIASAKKLDTQAPADANTVYGGVGKQVAGGSIELMAYRPQKLTIKAGTTVTFRLNSPMEV